MNALTICQPCAHLIATGAKPLENRTWPTRIRGDVAIHAGKSKDLLQDGDLIDYPNMAFGAIVAVARLAACLKKDSSIVLSWDRSRWGRWWHLIEHEHALGPWCFVFEDVRRLARPIPCRGAQGFWVLPSEAALAIASQVAVRETTQ